MHTTMAPPHMLRSRSSIEGGHLGRRPSQVVQLTATVSRQSDHLQVRCTGIAWDRHWWWVVDVQ